MDISKIKSFISELCNTKSVSGEETLIQNKVFDFFSKTRVPHRDILGNVYCEVAGEHVNRVMISAHVDEIGLIVNYIDDNGYIYFSNIGFVEPVNLVGQRVWINNVPGVISKNPSYFLNKNELSKEITIEELWIDIGACNKEEAENTVFIGDTISFANEVLFLSNDRILSKSLDNKAGIMTMLSLFESISKSAHLNTNITFVSTVQEEIGFRGAKTAANHLKPTAAIVIDVTNATDTPDSNKKKFGDIRIDGGPVIGIGANINKKMASLLMDMAKKNDLPFQTKAFAATSNTEANIIQIANEGVKTCVVAIPCRYMHSSYEMVSLNDIIGTARLIELACLNFDKV